MEETRIKGTAQSRGGRQILFAPRAVDYKTDIHVDRVVINSYSASLVRDEMITCIYVKSDINYCRIIHACVISTTRAAGRESAVACLRIISRGKITVNLAQAK